MSTGSSCCTEWSGARVSRRRLLGSMGALAGGLALASHVPAAASAQSLRVAGGPPAQPAGARVRWLGGGVAELSTPDDRQIALVDAWVWNNAGYERFGAQKPAEYASAANFAESVRARNPEAVLVLLTHDHGDHFGDFFELLGALNGAGVNVKAMGQSDLMRIGLIQRFRDNGLDPAQILVNGGAGANFGGRAAHGGMQAWLVPAVHSTTLGFPAAGFVVDVGGVRFYASGDTDLFGDMKLIGERYRPQVALVCAGDGPFTMGPREAAWACQLLGVPRAIPIHYAHNAAVMGVQAGEQFRQAAAELAPGLAVELMTPGGTTALSA